VGLTPDSPGVVPVGRGRGLGAKSVDTWIGPIDTFTIGNEKIRDTAILFGDLFKDATYTEIGCHVPRQVAGLQQMLLGIDFPACASGADRPQPAEALFQLRRGPVFQPAARFLARPRALNASPRRRRAGVGPAEVASGACGHPPLRV
jgi:hypothetical protein